MIDAFIAYLVANTENFTTIGHAWTEEPVESINEKVPALFAYRAGDTPGSNEGDNVVARMMTRLIKVQLVCAIAEFDSLQSELYGAALGWSAGAGYTDLQPEGGEIMGLKGSLFWWEESFSNRIKLSEV